MKIAVPGSGAIDKDSKAALAGLSQVNMTALICSFYAVN